MKHKSAVIASIASLAALLIMAAGFLLPTIVSGMKDRQTLDQINTIDSETINFDAQTGLSLLKKLDMIRYNSSGISIENGQYQTSVSAVEQGLSELKEFIDVFHMNFDADSCVVEDCFAQFVLDSANPANSMIVWVIQATDSTGKSMALTLDDESGKILSLSYDAKQWISYNAEITKSGLDEGTRQKLENFLTDYWSVDIAVWNCAEQYPGYLYYILELTDGTNSTEITLQLYEQIISLW